MLQRGKGSSSMTDTIVVTGGAGFIGSNFVRYALMNSDARIVVIDKMTYAGDLANLEGLMDQIEFVQEDIQSLGARMWIRATQPRYIVNFAAETHVDRSIDGPRAFIQTNVNGTLELLEAVREYVPNARFLQVSTDEVYGSLGPNDPPFVETTPYAPNSPYAASKASADHLVRAYHKTYGLQTLVTHCSNNYGPRQFPEKLIPLMIMNALDGKPLPIYGDGKNVRDWIHVDDHCAALWRVLQDGRAGEAYGIGSDCERTNIEIVDLVCGILGELTPGIDYTCLKTFVADRPGHDHRYAIDASKIRRELGWVPRRPFEAVMPSTVQWYFKKWQAR